MRCTSLTRAMLVLVVCVTVGLPVRADEPSLADELPRIPPTEPADALATFTIQHGFSLQLVAHEPLVADPVDACFDAAGRLYVAEMHGYPYSPEPREMQPEPLGKKDACLVRRLEDTDGDGVFDRSTVYADRLNWCLSVCCYDDGVFALAPPHLYYFKDTTGDGVADVREIVFTGFSRYNVQGLANNMKWGPDNRIYVAGGTNSDTELRRGDERLGRLRGRDFSFDPRTRDIRFESGGLQFGHSFDDWGNRFVCSNSNHSLHVAFPARYLDRTPGVTVSGVVRSIAQEGGAAPVFRTSPPEPWRIVRTRRRAADPEYRQRLPPTELVATGFFTSAAGVTIYRGDAYPPEFQGNVFVGDVGGNLVHRKTLTPDGISFVAARADENVEFIASTDNWFRPVNFVNGPDGCLYLLDMYRETIEHPASIPDDIKEHLDLYSGSDRGRIYRLIPPGWMRRPFPNLSRLTPVELAAQLASANAWHRDTAQRLLYERGDSAAADCVRAVLRKAASPQARFQALGALEAIGDVTDADLVTFSCDPDPRVRCRVVQLMERHGRGATEVTEALLRLADDDDVRVQAQVALTVGEFDAETAALGLARLAAHGELAPDVQQAMLTAVGDRAATLANDLIRGGPTASTPGGRNWLARLCELAAIRSDAGVLETLQTLAAREPSDQTAAVDRDALHGLARGLRTRGTTLTRITADDNVSEAVRRWLTAVFEQARSLARDAGAALDARTAAMALLSQDDAQSLAEIVPELLAPQQPQQIQIAAVRALADQPGDEVAALLLEAWSGTSPAVRAEIVDALLRGQGRSARLIAAIEAGDIQPAEIAADKRQALLDHPDAALRRRAADVLQAAATDRQAVIDLYAAALNGEHDAGRGRIVFEKTCANCHRVAETGHAVGPDLASVANKSPQDLLIAVLDPGREAQPIYANYTALLVDGRLVTGLIAAETASTVTFRRAEGKEDVVLRDQIEELRSTGASLMPVGLEKDITAEQLADVIEFIRSLPPRTLSQ